ncbi:unnamed protein product [Larinioides sclopetarius]|uniref:Uncharacterized protein n=1 Tax=Larinioides sclopetarius TaxID=280406 RepID=A0AAV2A3T8_9ARAC
MDSTCQQGTVQAGGGSVMMIVIITEISWLGVNQHSTADPSTGGWVSSLDRICSEKPDFHPLSLERISPGNASLDRKTLPNKRACRSTPSTDKLGKSSPVLCCPLFRCGGYRRQVPVFRISFLLCP